MLAIKIDNPEIESKFREYVSQQKKDIGDIVSDAISLFLELHKKDDKLVYTKKDPTKHTIKIDYEDDGEDLSDVKPYSHIENSAQYIHDLRRQRT